MQRANLKNRMLPDYTRREEIFNMVSHIVGGGFGVIALASCVIMAAVYGNVMGIVSGRLLAGGISYTIGAILYGLGKRIRYMHSIFHLFVVFGSILQYVCILLYVMP